VTLQLEVPGDDALPGDLGMQAHAGK
jgi:hypothetical protein